MSVEEGQLVFGYTAEGAIRVAADYVSEQLQDTTAAEDRAQLLEGLFPSRPCDPLQAAVAFLRERDEALHDDMRFGPQWTVEQFKAWCAGEQTGAGA